ncbi:hypothetical protein NliqN6_2671 [Naganishia liquefaciens]|uniref:Uncharacterized protein n=1 Tax=Naganishia liquefaciens TaxID=104408 RepID=A0A8H3TU83_9TREE|nr:hypothetical protein NliqN6_2671 [Naganishia liquefaciens]
MNPITQSSVSTALTPQRPPTFLLHLDKEATLVEDADEEIFSLYANLATDGQQDVTKKSGLGFVSSSEATYHVEFTLQPVNNEPAPDVTRLKAGGAVAHSARRNRSRKAAGRQQDMADKTIAVDISQDLASLRNRKGDTGSVIWRSSLFLAKQILQLYHFPNTAAPPFLTFDKAASSRVLELGAGTGVLGILLHELFASWTATDQYDNLKLISRNVKHNGEPKNMQIEEVDWVDLHKEKVQADKKHAGSQHAARTRFLAEEYDLIMAVDCIYNEALIPPFVSALEHYTIKGKTIVMVVCELRSADVMTVFLEEWIGRGGWTIYRLSDTALGQELKYSFVAWVAWKS